MPDTTKEIVELTKYLEEASTVQVISLQQQVNEAAERLKFLVDYATLPRKFVVDLMKSFFAKIIKAPKIRQILSRSYSYNNARSRQLYFVPS